MKKMKILFFVLFMVLSSYNINASETKANGVINEDIKQTQEELKYQKELEALMKLENKTVSLRATSDARWVKINVPYYKQINNYYCGPATLLQTVKFFNKKSTQTQKKIATKIGTTTQGSSYSSLRDFMKYKDYKFFNVTGMNKTNVGNYITYNITKSRPVILNMAIYSSDKDAYKKFGYHSNGHFLSADGGKGVPGHYAYGNVTHVRVVDPFQEYGNNPTASRKKNIVVGMLKGVIDKQPSSKKYILI